MCVENTSMQNRFTCIRLSHTFFADTSYARDNKKLMLAN